MMYLIRSLMFTFMILSSHIISEAFTSIHIFKQPLGLQRLASSRYSDGLNVLNNSAFSLLTAEGRCIRAMRACRSTDDIQIILNQTPNVGVNIAAAAIRSILKLNRSSTMELQALQQLIRIVEEDLSKNYQNTGGSQVTLYALQDVLYSLAILKDESLLPMANKICNSLSVDLTSLLDKMETRRLVEIMESGHALSLKNHSVLFDAVALRLGKTDALGKISPSKLCDGLIPLASYPSTLLSFLRRLRKSDIRRRLSSNSIVLALRSAVQLLDYPLHSREEISTMAYTLVQRELTRPLAGNTTTRLDSEISPQQAASILHVIAKMNWKESTVVGKLCHLISQGDKLSPSTIAMSLQALLKLEIQNLELDWHLAHQFEFICQDSQQIEVRSMMTILGLAYQRYQKDEQIISHYAKSLQVWLCKSSAETEVSGANECEIANFIWFLSRDSTYQNPFLSKQLGLSLLSRVSGAMEPQTIVKAISFAVTMCTRNVVGDALNPYFEVAKKLCVTECWNGMTSKDLSYLMESIVIARWDDKELISNVFDKVLEPQTVISFCSPSSARRILSSTATLATRIPTHHLQESQHRIFHTYGPCLLTIQLLPHEAAEAAIAYAKVGYIADMGVFDFVTELVANNLSALSTRLVAQSLWACGKLYGWEVQQSLQFPPSEGSMQGQDIPPYVESARLYAQNLAQRTNELSPRDLAQSLWAMGKMELSDQNTAQLLASRVKQVLPDCWSCEISNIVWGLSKIGYVDDSNSLLQIAQRIMDENMNPSPKEAACVLYALGNAGIRDDTLFEHLTEQMMSKVESVGAQAMANALWAHNVVGKLPPPSLLRSWATKKLGLSGFSLSLPESDFSDFTEF